ncbi:hypothetical protein GH808_00695 [Acetobacterium fimetarium]|uniref:Clostridial hydrophobic W n=1 Tax=Acetobacterium fimetarium TaxID=52691 RepID=A0ABR6WQW5_9FIRM|nr:hypothetical protein [Acetobacterium fimetarium]MBC3802961.1 hypothetical protein [Acetobacterium fimetarium]
MLKKKVLVLGLAVALLVGSGSVYASPVLQENGVVADSAIEVTEVGVPNKLLCDHVLIVPRGTVMTAEILLNHFTIVDLEGNDLGMKDKIMFSGGPKSPLLTADEKAKQINDGLSRGEITAGVIDYPWVCNYFGLGYSDVVEDTIPAGIISNPAFEIPADVDITGDLLRSHFTIVDAEGNDLDMKDKLRFMTGKGGLMTPEEQATILTNAFKEDVKRVVSVIALVDGYPSLYCEANVRLGQIVNKPYSIAYATHVQNEGWQKEVKDGKISGTEGKSLRLEGITIESGIEGVGVEYATHVQNIGWQDYVANGKMSGTEGKSYRLEAIKIRLTGENSSQYDVYYRVHAQNIGWMGWASNDAESGTAGFSYRLEGIEIKIVEKGTVIDVGGVAFLDANVN